MVLGIVGKIGSGKSLAVKYLKESYNATIFDCDSIAKEIIDSGESTYEPGYAGEVFINKEKQEECRTILHPMVFNKISERMNNLLNDINENNLPKPILVIESALPSNQLYKMCDKVIYIDSLYEDRVKRLQLSRDYHEAKTKLIYDSQKYYENIYKKADYKIMNNGTKEELERKIDEVLNEIYITCK